jgi:hypothetical protein
MPVEEIMLHHRRWSTAPANVRIVKPLRAQTLLPLVVNIQGRGMAVYV